MWYGFEDLEKFQRLSLKLDSALTSIDPDDPRDQLRASRIIGDQTNRVRKELRAALDPSHLEADARFLKPFMVGCIRMTANSNTYHNKPDLPLVRSLPVSAALYEIQFLEKVVLRFHWFGERLKIVDVVLD